VIGCVGSSKNFHRLGWAGFQKVTQCPTLLQCGTKTSRVAGVERPGLAGHSLDYVPYRLGLFHTVADDGVTNWGDVGNFLAVLRCGVLAENRAAILRRIQGRI